MASLGSLVVTLAADTARFQSDLGRAVTIAESRMRNIKDTAARSLGALTVAATAAGAAIVVALKAATDRADEMKDLAQASGVTVEELTRLEYAAKFSGTSLESVSKALVKLAKDGAPDANEALLQVADQIAAMPDGAAKTAAAVEIFGEKLGPGLVPLLSEGRAGLRAFAEEADRTGNTISTRTAQAAADLNDSVDRLRLSLLGLTNQALAQVAPSLAAYAAELVKGTTATDGLASSTSSLAAIVRGIIAVVDIAATTFVAYGRALGATVAANKEFLSGNFRQGFEIIRTSIQDTSRTFDEARARLAALYRDIETPPEPPKPPADTVVTVTAKRWSATDEARAVAAAAKLEEDAIRRRAAAYEETLRPMREYWALADEVQAGAGDTFRAFVNSTEGGIAAEVQTQFEKATEAVKGSTDEMSVYAEQAARNMQDAFADFLFDPFKGGLKGMLDGFLTTIRRMVAEAAAARIFGAFKDAASGSSGGFLSGVGKLFGFANGGSFTVGGNGGTDSQLVAFRATPGERVDVRTPAQQMAGGGIVFAPVYNISGGGDDLEGRMRAESQRQFREFAGLLQRYNPGLRI